jgi:hypothetical protein
MLRKDFVNFEKKNIEREPVNAVFLLDGRVSVPVSRRIYGTCAYSYSLSATSLYSYLWWKIWKITRTRMPLLLLPMGGSHTPMYVFYG